MKQTNLFYRIGPHLLRITGHSPLEPSVLLPSFAPFRLSTCEEQQAIEAIEVDICPCDTEVHEAQDTFAQPVFFDWEGMRCTIRRLSNGDYQLGIAPLSHPDTVAYAECSRHFRCNRLYIPEALLPHASFVVNNFLMMIYTFATAAQGTLMVHASVVLHAGKGYLFLGKSGTGKSTHASLWLKHIEGTRLLNDDNPVVAVDPKTGQVTVYGTPWSGKTPCYLNESAPVSAIVRLAQAPYNEIERLPGTRAFAALLPSCSCLRQDMDIYRGIIDTVTHVAMHIPLCNLRCLPDKAAARLCMQTVTQAAQP